MAWSEVYEVPVPKLPYDFHLHGLCDIQAGSKSSCLDLVKMRVEEICDDPVDSGVVIPGDIEDEDRPSTRVIRRAAFAGREEAIERDADKHRAWLKQEVVPLLLPLQKTKYGIMGVLAGHHWTQLSPILNSVQFICYELERLSGRKVPYLGEMSTFMDIRFRHNKGSVRKVVHVQHGEGGGQTKSASLNKLDRTSQGFVADAYIRAHDCQIVAAKYDQLYPKETNADSKEPVIMARNVAVLNLGSATRGYEVTKQSPSYVEAKMMRPSAMGWGTLKFRIRQARVWEDPSKNLRGDLRVEI